jgi:pimeloyl-ACP methyl ester carboxylesterase
VIDDNLLPFCGYSFEADLDSFSETKSLASFKQSLTSNRLSRFTLLGHGAGVGLAQLASLELHKQVRRLVLLDAVTRPSASSFERFVDWVEGFFPLGLPLRRQGKALDTRVFLHRIHCPVLLLVSNSANKRSIVESEYLAAKLPNAWFLRLKQDCWKDGELEITEEISEVLRTFDQVPTKRPQKNRS